MSAGADAAPDDRRGERLLFDISSIDLGSRALSKAELEAVIPHRGAMLLLDAIAWHSPDYTRGVGVTLAREDAFWAAGHFPGHPLMPGVIMIEAAAQAACFLYNARFPYPKVIAFSRIEDCRFRSMVRPRDTLYILCNQIRCSRRMFCSDVQGLVDGREAFEARITGISVNPDRVPFHRAPRA